MRRTLMCLAVLAVLGRAAPLRAQEIKSPADVMPAKALIYGELRHPGQLGQEIAELFAGSALSNVPESLQKFKSKYEKVLMGGWRHDEQMLGMMGLIFAPEVVKELQRVQGAGVSFTGWNDKEGPEFIAVLLPGESNAPAFLFRTMLTMAPMKPAGTCEGVALYQLQAWSQKGGKIDKDGKREKVVTETHSYGPLFAMTPRALLVGSPDNVKETIRRIKGKADGPSLGQNKRFQEAKKAIEDRPGLFVYANPVELVQTMEKLFPERERGTLNMVKAVLNPKAFRALAYGISLDKGSLYYREVALLDAKEKSPLLEILPTKALDPALLQFAPRDAVIAAALSNVDGEKRWDKALEMADALCPEKQKPSAFIKDLEKRLQVSLGKDVVGPITGIAFAMGDPMNAPVKRIEEKGPNFRRVHSYPEIPMVFIVKTGSDKAAERIVELVPTLYGAMAGHTKPAGKKGKDNLDDGAPAKLTPVRETIKGQDLYVLKVRPGDALYYGRHGSTIVLGPYGRPVAESLNAGAKGKGLLSDPRAAERIKAMNHPVGLVLAKPLTLIVGGAMFLVHGESASGDATIEKEFPKKKTVPKDTDPAKPETKERKAVKDEPSRLLSKGVGAKNKENQGGTSVKESIQPRSPEEEKMLKTLSKMLAQEEWLVLGVTRKAERMQVDGQMAGLRKIVPQLTDFVVDMMFQMQAMQNEHLRKERERFEKGRFDKDEKRFEKK